MRSHGSGFWRPFFLRFLPVTTLLLLFLSTLIYQGLEHRRQLYLDTEQMKLDYVTESISIDMERVFHDLFDLMHRRSVTHYLADPNPENLHEVEQSYLLFSLDNPQYDQLRLIDPSGQEIVRVNAKDGRSWLVAKKDLQNKADRYYFKDAVTLPQGELYTSPLDLNIEHKQIELPHKPMLRIAAPLYDTYGKVKAVLVLNYLGQVLLDNMQGHLEYSGQTIMLINQDGYWLHGGGEEANWAFMFPDRTDRTFAAAHPKIWKAMQETESGQLEGPGGIYTYDTLKLSPKSALHEHHRNATVAPEFVQTWKVVSFTPITLMSAMLWQDWPQYLAAALLVIILSGLGAYLHTSRMLERQAAQQAERRSEARFRDLVETSPDLIWETDSKGNFVYVSPRSADLFGLEPEELVGKPLCGILSTEWDEQHFEESAGKAPACWEMTCYDTQGERKILEVRYLPVLDDHNNAIGRRGVARDITQAKKAQQLIEESRQEAERANQAKGEFLARMSHEIRTPLNAVIGMSHLMLRTELSQKQRDYLNKIRLSSDALLGVINDILDYSKIEVGKIAIEHVEFDLDTVLGNVVDINSLNAEEKRLEFLLSVEDGVPSNLIGDPLRLGQVLMNLLSNALKFTDEGEVLLRVSTVEKDEETATLRFSVRDTGIGLSQEHLENLFKPFSQADGSISRRFGGTGLGLSICSHLVQLMGGALEVDSTQGQGSDFHFTLTFPIGAATTRLSFADAEGLSGSAVLVVDDNATSRQILKDILTSLRFSVTLAESAEEALRLIERGEETYNVILLDWKMQGMDGLSCAKRIRAMPLETQPALIMITAYSREEVRRESENIGIDGFLLKPVSRSVLFNTIAEALGSAISSGSSAGAGGFPYEAGAEGIRGAHILLVEDNEINQQVASELLEAVGLRVTVAGDGETALELLARDTFQAVLMDIQMPGITGLEATRRVRNELGLKELPVIAMTAHAMSDDRKESLAAGMNDHVNKPFDPRELIETLRRWISDQGWEPDESAPPEQSTPIEDAPAQNQNATLDHELGLYRVRGNAVLYRKLLADFARKYESIAESFKEKMAASEKKEARRMAHTLKGVAGNIGALRLFNTASEMESCINTGLKPCTTMLGQLESDMAATMQAVQEYLDTHHPKSTAQNAGPMLEKQELITALANLARLLEEHDTRALDEFKSLEPTLAAMDEATTNDLALALRSLQFKKALPLTQKLCEQVGTLGAEA
ncbi:response regulator [Oceanidesulfovibrio marinus]|uniref:histidine kinase n=1 Tax=Oceanidesulfovibrio marinus TaxID=370038 RepID=A0ABX6NDM7_9BACT|nr:response regulator [Oceanidesulfovibrio marinus]QJT08698.1 response regulator [Oceanidesulfovibrio marinus]